MIHLNDSFKKMSKEKWIVFSILVFFFIVGVMLFVLGSFYKYDYQISHDMEQGLDYAVIKGWATYTMLDGFNILVEFAIALAAIIGESIYVHYRQEKTKMTNATKKNLLTAYYVLLIVIFFVAVAISVPYTYFKPQGFGWGFVPQFIAGWEYLIPEYVVSVIINALIGSYLLYYVHYKLAKRPTFLAEQYWKKALAAVCYIFITYFVTLVLKFGMGRPDPFRVYWGDHVQKIEDYLGSDNQRWLDYLKPEQNKFYPGWNDGTGNKMLSYPKTQDWPWYVPVHGLFNKGTDIYKQSVSDGDFPSGHFNEMAILMYISFVIFSTPNNKKAAKNKRIFFWVLAFWWVNMFFAILVSQGHWVSDIGFTVVWDGLSLPLATLLYQGIEKTVNSIKNSFNL